MLTGVVKLLVCCADSGNSRLAPVDGQENTDAPRLSKPASARSKKRSRRAGNPPASAPASAPGPAAPLGTARQPSPAAMPVVPAFDASMLAGCDFSDKKAAERSVPRAFLDCWTSLRQQVSCAARRSCMLTSTSHARLSVEYRTACCWERLTALAGPGGPAADV